MTIDLLINIALALMMFNIGSSLRFSDFDAVIRNSRTILVGLSLQMVALPLFTFLILQFIHITPEYKLGIFILSLCPGGTTSNFVSYLVKSDVPLSVLLTGVNSFFILITLPLLTAFGYDYFIHTEVQVQLPYAEIIGTIFSLTLVPVFLGMLLRNYLENVTSKIEKPLKYISIIALFLVFAVKIFADKIDGGSDLSSEDFISLFLPLLLVHIFTLIISYVIAIKLIHHYKSSVTIAIEVGLQNTALALLVTTVILQNEDLGKPAIIYAGFSFFTTFIFGYLMLRKPNKKLLEN